MSFSRIALSGLTVATLALFATPSFAAFDTTISNSFDVKVQVNKACIFTAGKAADVVFTTVDTNSTADQTVSTNIKVKCSKNTSFEIALTPGNNSDTGGLGFMKLSTAGATPTVDQKINYTLKKGVDSSAWGNKTGVNAQASKGTGAEQSFKVDATVLGASWNVEPGAYLDTVTVTVNY